MTTTENTPISTFSHLSTSGKLTVLETPHVVDKITTDDIISKYKLDTWEARLYPNLDPDRIPVDVDKSNYIIKHDFETERESTVFNLKVNNKYQILQYPKGLRWLDYFLKEGFIDIVDALYIDDGKLLAINCSINESDYVRNKADTISPYLMFCLSHDSTPRGLFFNSVRLSCRNTVAAARVEALSNLNKSFSIDASPAEMLEKAKILIDWTTTTFTDEHIPMLKELEGLDLEFQQVQNIVKDVFKLKRTEPIPLYIDEEEKPSVNIRRAIDVLRLYHEGIGMNEYGVSEHTGYRLLNAFTEAGQYYGKQGGYEPNSAFRSHYYGAGRTVRTKVMEYLLEMV